MNPLTICILEIPMDLADRWDAMLKTDGRFNSMQSPINEEFN